MATKSIKKIYLDMDGVLSDFDKMLEKHDIDPNLPDDEFWTKIKAVKNFWTGMPLFPGANQLVEYVRSLNVPIYILTAPPSSIPVAKAGKMIWAKAHKFNFPIHFKRAQDKHEFAEPGAVLIDDRADNIDDWNKAGGIGIQHKNLALTLNELKKHVGENNEQSN